MTRPPRASSRAFTMVEVMLALALVGALMGALLGFYQNALDIRREMVGETELFAAEQEIMQGITDELRSAFAYPFLNLGVEGAADQISLVSAGLPGPAAWAARSSTEDPIPPEQDLRLITYRLRIDANTTEVLGLERSVQKVLAAESAAMAMKTRLVSSRIVFLNLAYYDGSSWRSTWRMESPSSEGEVQTSLLPMAVEVRLGATPKPEDMPVEEYLAQYPTHRRVVYLAVGARPLTSGAGSGGSGTN